MIIKKKESMNEHLEYLKNKEKEFCSARKITNTTQTKPNTGTK